MARAVEDSVSMAVLRQGVAAILWADAELEALNMDYESVVLCIRESTGRRVELHCLGHIGLSIEGFWDEIVIEAADIVEAHPFLERCLASLTERLGEEPPPTGSPARNSRQFSTLVVRLADGARVLCAAAGFENRSQAAK